MSKRLRIIVDIIDEDGTPIKIVRNGIIPQWPIQNYSNTIETPLIFNKDEMDNTEWFSILRVISHIVSADWKKNPVLSPLYPKGPYGISWEPNSVLNISHPIWSELSLYHTEAQNLHTFGRNFLNEQKQSE